MSTRLDVACGPNTNRHDRAGGVAAAMPPRQSSGTKKRFMFARMSLGRESSPSGRDVSIRAAEEIAIKRLARHGARASIAALAAVLMVDPRRSSGQLARRDVI